MISCSNVVDKIPGSVDQIGLDSFVLIENIQNEARHVFKANWRQTSVSKKDFDQKMEILIKLVSLTEIKMLNVHWSTFHLLSFVKPQKFKLLLLESRNQYIYVVISYPKHGPVWIDKNIGR